MVDVILFTKLKSFQTERSLHARDYEERSNLCTEYSG